MRSTLFPARVHAGASLALCIAIATAAPTASWAGDRRCPGRDALGSNAPSGRASHETRARLARVARRVGRGAVRTAVTATLGLTVVSTAADMAVGYHGPIQYVSAHQGMSSPAGVPSGHPVAVLGSSNGRGFPIAPGAVQEPSFHACCPGIYEKSPQVAQRLVDRYQNKHVPYFQGYSAGAWPAILASHALGVSRVYVWGVPGVDPAGLGVTVRDASGKEFHGGRMNGRYFVGKTEIVAVTHPRDEVAGIREGDPVAVAHTLLVAGKQWVANRIEGHDYHNTEYRP